MEGYGQLPRRDPRWSKRLDQCLTELHAGGWAVQDVRLIHFGVSKHEVFRVTTSARSMILKLYGATRHIAREREIRGYEAMVSHGCPVPDVLWTSSALHASLFSEMAGVGAGSLLRTKNSEAIGREIGAVLARSMAHSRINAARKSRFAQECIQYTMRRCATSHGRALAHAIFDKLDAWSVRLRPKCFCEVSFDCRLEHFLFNGSGLNSIIDLEHWDIFDPAVDVGDLLHDLQESIEDCRLRRLFCCGLASGLGEFYHEIAQRLPFYLARRYLIKKPTSGLSAPHQVIAAARFWLDMRFESTMSPRDLVSAIEAAPVMRA